MLKKLALLAAASAALAFTSPAAADGGLTFLIDGDTYSQPFTITNTSTAGESVLAFGITLIAPYAFDTEDGGFGNDPVAFAPLGGTDVTTGYTGPSAFADGSNSLNFTFNNFQVGEFFRWDIDVDESSDSLTVYGSDLIGSTGYADFSNGLRGLGTFEAYGSQGSQFVINTFTEIPSAIPEPKTWALMIAGFAAVGGALRVRRRTASRLLIA